MMRRTTGRAQFWEVRVEVMVRGPVLTLLLLLLLLMLVVVVVCAASN